jgi:murein DD-endopeptidase MepM/ murein hydrolase activator NlpD
VSDACRAAALGLAVLAAPALAPASAGADVAPPLRTHEVAPGDTLRGLAKRYGATVGAFVAANQLRGADAPLTPGQRLVIPGPPPRPPAIKPRARAKAPAAPAMARPAPAGPRPPASLVLAVPDFDDVQLAFAWPAEGPVTSTFGRRRSNWHRGIDIKADRGTPVWAAAAGVVLVSRVEPRYGRVIKLAHDHGVVTVYAHNEQNLVRAGDRVAAGETIATVGRTGRATAHHVHFEIRRDGRAYNPLYLLPLPPRIAHVEETDESAADE